MTREMAERLLGGVEDILRDDHDDETHTYRALALALRWALDENEKAVAAEREACAKECRDEATVGGESDAAGGYGHAYRDGALSCYTRIQARSTTRGER